MVRTRKPADWSAGLLAPLGSGSEVDSLRRGLEILRLFDARHRSLDLAEIAGKLDLPTATTAKLVETLVSHNFLRSSGRRDRFEPHVAALSLGRAVKSGLGILRIAQPRMNRLAERFDVHAILATRDRLDMIVVDNRLPRGKALLGLGMGARFPIMASASGRAYLWATPEAMRASLMASLQGEMSEPHFRRLADVYAAFQELEEQGWCVVSAPVNNQSSSVAAPIRCGEDVYVLAAMTVGEGEAGHDLRRDIAPDLRAAAQAIAADLPANE